MSIKLNFKIPLLDVDSTIMKENGEDLLLSNILGNALRVLTDGIEPMKALDWMLQLRTTGVLDLDRADQDKLKKLLNDSASFRGMIMLVRGRLLEVFENAEPKK